MNEISFSFLLKAVFFDQHLECPKCYLKYTKSIQLLFLNLVSISIKLEFDNFVKGPTFENIFGAENFGISIWRGAIMSLQ